MDLIVLYDLYLLAIIAAVCFLSQVALAADCTTEQLTAVTDYFNTTEIRTSISACMETTPEESCGNCKAMSDSFAAFNAPDCTIEGTTTKLKTEYEPFLQQAVKSWARACDAAASTTLSLMLLFFCAMVLLNN